MGRSGRIGVHTAVIAATLALAACGEGKSAGNDAGAASAPDLGATMLAVFPDAANGEVAIPATADAPARVERPKAAIAGEAGRVYLVTAKELVDSCHACSASVSVYYLKDANGALALSASYRDLYESGGWGQAGEIAALTLPRNGGIGMTDESGFTAQGCTVTNVSAYRFDEDGPKQILDRAPLSRSQDAIDIGGTLVRPYTADSDFVIHYLGNNNSVPVDTTVMWQMQNGVLAPLSGRIPDPVAEGC